MTSMVRGKKLLYVVALAALVAVGSVPASAGAETVFATADLHEVRESINCNPGPVAFDPLCSDPSIPGERLRHPHRRRYRHRLEHERGRDRGCAHWEHDRRRAVRPQPGRLDGTGHR